MKAKLKTEERLKSMCCTKNRRRSYLPFSDEERSGETKGKTQKRLVDMSKYEKGKEA
jgi:hypothetical protein